MLFLSTYHNRIDKKGRVSVPAGFRAHLALVSEKAGEKTGENGFSGVIVYPSFVNPCIEACALSRIEALAARIEALDPFSEERDAFATAILGSAAQLAFDGEGRITLPEALLAQAGIGETVTFVGKGATFELWDTEAFGEYETRSRAIAREKRHALRASGGPI